MSITHDNRFRATIPGNHEVVDLIDSLTVEWVTPSLAQAYLDTIYQVDDTNARAIRPIKVTEIACDIVDGNWSPLMDSLKFDTRGILRDGNNRCKAIIEADTPVQTMILRDCSEAFLTAVDTGTTRNTAHVLEINNTYNPKMTSRALILQWQYENQYQPGSRVRTRIRSGLRPLSTRNILDHLKHHPRILESVRHIESEPGLKVLGSLGEFAWCHYAISNVNPGRRDLVDEFFKRLAQGIFTQENDVLISLRGRLFQNVNSRQVTLKLAPGMGVALVLKGWNLWVQGEAKQVLVWKPDPGNAMSMDPSGYGELYPHPIQAE